MTQIALSVSGGGVNCFTFVGALMELDQWLGTVYGRRLHAHIHSAAGCSMGGVIAALTLSGIPLEAIHAVLRTRSQPIIDTGIKSINLDTFTKNSGGIIPFPIMRAGIADVLSHALGRSDYTMEEFRVVCAGKPLYLTVTDLQARRPMVISAETHPRMPLVDVLAASCCIPGIFTPYLDPSSRGVWVDGCITDNSPTPHNRAPWLQLQIEDRTAGDLYQQLTNPNTGTSALFQSLSVYMQTLTSLVKIAATMAVFGNQKPKTSFTWKCPLVFSPLPTKCSPSDVDTMITHGRHVALSNIVTTTGAVAFYIHSLCKMSSLINSHE